MKSLSNLFFLCFVLIFWVSGLSGQEKKNDHSYKPLTLKLDDSGDKYLRLIMWHQIWVTSNNLSAENTSTSLTTSIRRSRMLAFAQVSPRFLILTHFGLNGFSPENQTSLGNNGDSPQLFLHGAWGELKLNNHIYVGAGLHYWKGLTRLASQSTLNFMTMDQSRPFLAWHSLGITDQFARHLGLYLKGSKGKFEYRMAWNNPGRSPLGAGKDYSADFNQDGNPSSSLTYTGVSKIGKDGHAKGNNIFEGYFKYNLWDNESTKLPYFVGTYLGKKKVLSIGAGFFNHPNGMYDSESGGHQSVSHYAVDAFLDMPVDGGALNIYGALQSFNYGANYISRWAGTGTSIYGQIGYYLNDFKIMPYLASSRSSLEGAPDPITTFDLGINYYINGHHAKITGEYHYIGKDYRESSISLNGTDNLSQFRLQLHVFL
jgi:hypothetical protein